MLTSMPTLKVNSQKWNEPCVNLAKIRYQSMMFCIKKPSVDNMTHRFPVTLSLMLQIYGSRACNLPGRQHVITLIGLRGLIKVHGNTVSSGRCICHIQYIRSFDHADAIQIINVNMFKIWRQIPAFVNTRHFMIKFRLFFLSKNRWVALMCVR